MRGALLALVLVGCGASRPPASAAPTPAPPRPSAAHVMGACEDDGGGMELLDAEREPMLVLGRGVVRVALHASGEMESSTASASRIVAVADLGERGWRFVDSAGVVWRSESFVGALEQVSTLPRGPVDPPRWLARFVQRDALGVVLEASETEPRRVVRVEADGAMTPLDVPPSLAIAFGSEDRAALALVGGGLGWLEAGAHRAIALDGAAMPLAGLAPREDGIVAWTSDGRAFLDGMRAIDADARPCARAALAREEVLARIARRDAEIPAFTAGTRAYFLEGDRVTLRARELDGSATYGPAALPSDACTWVALGAGVFATCPLSEGEASTESDEVDERERLMFLDASFSFVEIARGTIDEARDDAVISLRRHAGDHEEVCLVGPTGRLTCVDRAPSERPPSDVAGCGALGGAIRYRGGTAASAVVFDLATGAETEAMVPAARRRDAWRVDCGDGDVIEMVATSDAGTHRYRIVTGGARPVLFEQPRRVIHLDAYPCCFGAYAYRCVPAAASGEGTLDSAEMPLGPAVAVIGDERVEVTRSGDQTVVTRMDRHTGAVRATRVFAGPGVLATWDGALGVVVDETVFAPFDATSEPRPVAPPPDEMPGVACWHPPPCAPDHAVRGPLVFGEPVALVGLDAVGRVVTEQAGDASCVTALVGPAGETLSLRDRTFVGRVSVGGHPTDVTCTEDPEAR